jgi:hypothetical protein
MNRFMIQASHVVNGVWMGTVLLLLGLVPRLYEALAQAISRLGAMLALRLPISTPAPAEFRAPMWFPYAGAAIIALTLVARFMK